MPTAKQKSNAFPATIFGNKLNNNIHEINALNALRTNP